MQKFLRPETGSSRGLGLPSRTPPEGPCPRATASGEGWEILKWEGISDSPAGFLQKAQLV